MVGERYSHSLDVGKELEKEKEEEKKGEQPPLPCFCSPKIRPSCSEKEQEEKKEGQEKQETPPPEQEKKEEPAQEEKQEPEKEEKTEQQASERQEAGKEAVPDLQPEPLPDEQLKEPSIEVRPAELSEDSGWEQMEDVAPAEPQSPPDPVEEDVNAIITKDFPVLHPRKSIVEHLLERKLLLFVVFVALVGGVFLIWKLVLPEQPAAPQFLIDPSAAFVPANITLFPEQVPAVPLISTEIPEPAEYAGLPEQPETPEEGGVEEAVPAEAVVQANASSVDELPDFFAQQLKD